MGNNSILSNLNSNDIISNIKLEMGNDLEKNNVYVLIEGHDDKKLFQYLCSENVVLCESYSGKKGIEEVLKEFNGEEKIIGIRDRDYEKRKLDERIFFYDYCCMEMMLISCKNVFKRMFLEYYEGKLKCEELKNKILGNLKVLSILRKVNEQNKKMWNFNGINMKEIFLNPEFNEEKLYSELSRINNKEISNNDIIQKELEAVNCYEDMLSITNGHDFINLFTIYCKQENGKNLRNDTIGEVMRCTYSTDDFKESELYTLLFRYQSEMSIKIVD